jgi:hypothetical protein
MTEIKLTNKQAELIHTGSHAMVNGNSYYFLPFWFKQTGKENVFELHYLDHLPDELKEVISKSHEAELNLEFLERIYYEQK